jgi:Mn2+/Fe2+ NRAMP family transporter
MYELLTVGAIISAAHVLAVYIGTNILRLEYSRILALNIIFAAAISVVLKLTAPFWQEKLKIALEQEVKDKTVILDVFGMIGTFIVGGIITAVILFRRYGALGWFGVFASSALVNWFI